MEFIRDFRKAKIDLHGAYKYISSNKKNLFLTHEQLIDYINTLDKDFVYPDISKDFYKDITYKNNVIFIPDTSEEDVCLFIEGKHDFSYVLYSDYIKLGYSSIIVSGDKNCDVIKINGKFGNAVRVGKGDGCSYRVANANGNTFVGNAIRDGEGSGDSVSSGFCISNSIRIGNGIRGSALNFTCSLDLQLSITDNVPMTMNDNGTVLSLKYNVDKLSIPDTLSSNKKDLNLSLGYIIDYEDFIREFGLNAKEVDGGLVYEIEASDISLIIDISITFDYKKPITFIMKGSKAGSIQVRIFNMLPNAITVIRDGEGNGSAILSGKGHGNVLRLGSGDGHAIAMGVINGYVRNVTTGQGEAYKEGGLGEPRRLRSGETR